MTLFSPSTEPEEGKMGNSNELKNNLDQTTNMDEVRDEKKLTDDEASKATGGICDPASKASTELYNHVSQAGTTTAHLEDSGRTLWEQRVYDTVGSTILQLDEPHRAGQFEIKHAWDQEFGDAQ